MLSCPEHVIGGDNDSYSYTDGSWITIAARYGDCSRSACASFIELGLQKLGLSEAR